MGDTGMELLI